MADWLNIPNVVIPKPVKPEMPLDIRINKLMRVAPFYIAVCLVGYIAYRAVG